MKKSSILIGIIISARMLGMAQDSTNTRMLHEVDINSNKLKKFADTISSSGLRMNLPIVQTPQSVQVITHDVIQDQQAQTLNDVTKNMVGVIANNNFSSFTMRGFSSIESTYSNNFITFDGMLGNPYYWQQLLPLYNIENVENIGGPAAALYSVGTPGGVINMTTKRPLEQAAYSFNVTTGSWGLIDASADLGGPLSKNKKLTYRLNIGYNNQNSYRAYQYTENLVIAPSLSYKFNEKTSIDVDYVYAGYNTRVFEDAGGALLMNKDSTFNWKGVNKNTIFYSPDDYGTVKNSYATLSFKHKFSDHFKLNFISRLTESSLYSNQTTGNYFNSGPNTNDFMSIPDSMYRQYIIWNDKSYNFINSLYTTETFGGEHFKNTIITGIDYQLYGSKDYYVQGAATTLSFTNPNYSMDAFSNYPISAASFVEDQKQQTTQLAGYVQDLISIGNHIKVLLAGRYENFMWIERPNGSDNYTQVNDSSKAHVFIPRAGLVYSFNKWHSVYASYCESYSPQYDNSRNNGGPFPPQIGQQTEVGDKLFWLNGKLMTTIALYSIYWENILGPTPTPTNPNHESVIPGLTSQGIELSAMGNVKQFNLIGSYAYNNEVFATNSPLGNKGDRYDNSPRSIANLWVKYSFKDNSKLKRFSISIGGKYVGDRLGSTLLAPHYLMPAYFLLDAAINYSYKKFNFSLNGYNLLNATYITGWYASDFMAQVGTPLNWKLSIRYTIK